MRFVIVLLVATFSQAILRPLSASEPVTVVTDHSILSPRQPQLAVVDENTIFLAFGAGESVYICKSTDGGKSFQSPTEIDSLPKLALGMRRGPRVVASNKIVIVTAISHQSGNLTAWRSEDEGSTWSDPLVVNDVPEVAREGLHGMAISAKGRVFCSWLDLRHGKTQIYGSISVDEGRSWGENRRVYESPSGTVCECCHPSVAMDGEGAIHVMWRNVVDGHRDMYFTKSTDGGVSFQMAQKLGSGTWNLNACPMDGGDMAVSSSGDIATVWRRGNQIIAASEDPSNERFLGPGEQPEIAVRANGAYIVWLSRRGGELTLLKPNSTEAETIAIDASDPVIAAVPSSRDGIIVAWEVGSKPNIAIKAMVITE